MNDLCPALPQTGNNGMTIASIAVLAIAAGTVALFLGRRRALPMAAIAGLLVATLAVTQASAATDDCPPTTTTAVSTSPISSTTVVTTVPPTTVGATTSPTSPGTTTSSTTTSTTSTTTTTTTTSTTTTTTTLPPVIAASPDVVTFSAGVEINVLTNDQPGTVPTTMTLFGGVFPGGTLLVNHDNGILVVRRFTDGRVNFDGDAPSEPIVWTYAIEDSLGATSSSTVTLLPLPE